MRKIFFSFLCLIAVSPLFASADEISMEERYTDQGSHSRWSEFREVLAKLAVYQGPRDVQHRLNTNVLAQRALSGSEDLPIGNFRCFETLDSTPRPGAPNGIISTSRCVFDAHQNESGHRCEVHLAEDLRIHFLRCVLTAG